MSRYIDVEELIEQFDREIKKCEKNKTANAIEVIVAMGIRAMLKDVPKVNCQEVVYCKDCDHCKEHHYQERGEKPYTKYSCNLRHNNGVTTIKKGYCNYGKEKEVKT